MTKKQFVKNYKIERVCVVCGEANPKLLWFHRCAPSNKRFVLKNVAKYSWQEIYEELAKYKIICHNCCKNDQVKLPG